MSLPENSPIFYDPAGRRWRRVRRTWFALAVGATLIVGLFIASVLANPYLPKFNLRQIASLPKAIDTKPEPPALPPSPREQKAKKAEAELKKALASTLVVPGKLASQLPLAPPPPASMLPPPATPTTKPLTIGFYTNGDESAYASLKRNLNNLDWVVPEWSRLGDPSDGSSVITTDIDVPAVNLIRQTHPQTRIVPLLQNYRDEKWDAQLLAKAVGTEESRQRLIRDVTAFVDQNQFGGICIDLEEAPVEALPNLLTFVQELHSAFQPRGWVVAQAVPFDNPDWNYKAYSEATDYLMLMAYDQHWGTGEPGPVSAQTWFEENLVRRMKDLPPSKTIVCIGSYGYDWTRGEPDAETVTFQEAIVSARDSEAKITYDEPSFNPHFSFEEEDQSIHTVWFLDAASAYNQIRAASGYNCAGYALWRLGSEDPSIWSVFSKPENFSNPDAIRTMAYGYDVDFEGTGELLKVVAEPHDGEREIKVDSTTNMIVGESYKSLPSSYVIERAGDHPGQVALTFDDGPDPVWTPQILDILKEKNVPATFFVIGQNGQASPGLLSRIINEGHEIGNHTYTHPNLGEIPGYITDLELNATQRLIESVTGRSTILFRPPFFGDAEADKPEEVIPAIRAQKLGYIMVGLRIDPDDWQLPVTADEILNKTVKGATNKNPETRGQVILLHDAGGDRSATVAALPRIIDTLRARGVQFVSVSQLAGLTRDQVMPLVPANQKVYRSADAVAFYSLSYAGRVLHMVFLIGIVLGLGRMVFIGALALAQWVRARKRERTHAGEMYQPTVSIIIPAYNEETVIVRTIESLVASPYPDFEIIVVDDGSPDRTSEVVAKNFGDEPRVRLLTKANGGKAEALNYGLRYATGEIIIALDADTIFPAEAVGALAHRFYDPRIGAVAGNAKVGNRINVVTRWQALEYITSQNLDRRAFASLNCITVVPGAVGAWRRSLLETVGGFASDTLAEDQDLTIKVRKLGYKIGYEETAVAWTEAPDSLKSLSKQRFRWSFGTLQCMWKHRDALFRPRYGALGFIGMPNVWIFQVLFPLISPIMDLMLIWSLAQVLMIKVAHRNEYTDSSFQHVMYYYALFLAVDWLAAAFAFILEKRERWSLLWWLLLQRFCYRQIMYYVMVKSVAVAIRGAVVGWGKLERKATVQAES
jgi:cellulose synthase/poly-beta-1,6-N-acetylglucosamine synthase-like glycosyltransferase/peptidoglycan/xylan/chitin deacetylase (PgdA/CDA1 family)/spore germination protein YaaH